MQILDCTIRDGGYYTNWDYEDSLVDQYIDVMGKMPISYVELGYRSPKVPGYAGKYFYLPQETIEKIRTRLDSSKHIAVMLNAKDCQTSHIQPMLSNLCDMVKMIRIVVDPQKMEHGLELAKEVKKLGFEIAFNFMYLSKFVDNLEIYKKIAGQESLVDYVYLVDSFGACYPEQVKKAVKYVKSFSKIKIGFHGHENMNLAFANSLAAIEAGADIVDSTVLGMGRGAGNLRTEVILPYHSKRTAQNCDYASLGSLVNTFQKLQDQYRWGADLPYIISGLENLAPKDVMALISKKRYSTSAIVQILQGNAPELLEEKNYPKVDALKSKDNFFHEMESVVVIGGGPMAKKHYPAVVEFAKRNKAAIVHSSVRNIELYKNCQHPQLLCLPGFEIQEVLKDVNAYTHLNGFIVPTAPRLKAENLPKDIESNTYEVSPVLESNPDTSVNVLTKNTPLGLVFGVATNCKVKHVYLVGFDGYPEGSLEYAGLTKEVQDLINVFQKEHKEISLESLTPTNYEIPQGTAYA